MGTFARHLDEALRTTAAKYRLYDESLATAPHPVSASIAIRHGYQQGVGGDFRTANFAPGTTRTKNRNVLLMPIDAGLLHPGPRREIDARFDTVWFDSTWSMKRAIAAGLQFEHHGILPGSVDPVDFTERRPSSGLFRFLHVMNGNPYVKGTDLIIRAFKSATQRGMRASLLLVAARPSELHILRTHLIAPQLSGSQAHDRVQLQLGGRNSLAMARFYLEADCLVLASRTESFGLPVLEAAAYGLPVIIHNECGVAEHKGHYAHFLVEGNDFVLPAGCWLGNVPTKGFGTDVSSLADGLLAAYNEGINIRYGQCERLQREFGTAVLKKRVRALLEQLPVH